LYRRELQQSPPPRVAAADKRTPPSGRGRQDEVVRRSSRSSHSSFLRSTRLPRSSRRFSQQRRTRGRSSADLRVPALAHARSAWSRARRTSRRSTRPAPACRARAGFWAVAKRDAKGSDRAPVGESGRRRAMARAEVSRETRGMVRRGAHLTHRRELERSARAASASTARRAISQGARTDLATWAKKTTNDVVRRSERRGVMTEKGILIEFVIAIRMAYVDVLTRGIFCVPSDHGDRRSRSRCPRTPSARSNASPRVSSDPEPAKAARRASRASTRESTRSTLRSNRSSRVASSPRDRGPSPVPSPLPRRASPARPTVSPVASAGEPSPGTRSPSPRSTASMSPSSRLVRTRCVSNPASPGGRRLGLGLAGALAGTESLRDANGAASRIAGRANSARSGAVESEREAKHRTTRGSREEKVTPFDHSNPRAASARRLSVGECFPTSVIVRRGAGSPRTRRGDGLRPREDSRRDVDPRADRQVRHGQPPPSGPRRPRPRCAAKLLCSRHYSRSRFFGVPVSSPTRCHPADPQSPLVPRAPHEPAQTPTTSPRTRRVPNARAARLRTTTRSSGANPTRSKTARRARTRTTRNPQSRRRARRATSPRTCSTPTRLSAASGTWRRFSS